MYPDFDKNEKERGGFPENLVDYEELSNNDDFNLQAQDMFSFVADLQGNSGDINEEPQDVQTTQQDQQHVMHLHASMTSATTPTHVHYGLGSQSSPATPPQYSVSHPHTSPNRRPPQRQRKKNTTGIVRAVYLIILCSLFSAASAFAVIEFRVSRGDLDVPNQVILGSSVVTDMRPETGLEIDPVGVIGNEMLAEDIYYMALSQVVSISVPVPGVVEDLEPDEHPSASGSGFVISADGFVLTNYHVIEFANFHDLPVNVTLFDGTTYTAEVIGFEPENDVALLKIDSNNLTPVLIGDSDAIRVGQRVYAVGNPFGDLLYTMTDGIVSALDRVVTVEGRSISFFQTSAAVNRGNSGGPIYNTNGEVIGIVTAKVVRGNAEGIGFAIPINDAIAVARELIEHGFLAGRPLIGITGETVPPEYAEHLGWVVGAYIEEVFSGSAAENAGIQVHDIITALGGVDTDSMASLRNALREYRAGDTTTVTVWRDGEYHTLTITFDEDLNAGLPRPPRPATPSRFEGIELP